MIQRHLKSGCLRVLALAVILVLATAAHPAGPNPDPQFLKRVIRVGKTGEARSITEASRIARSGDVVEIEAGEYVGDVAVWAQKEITIRGVNGMARLVAGGASAEGKGTWVVRGERLTVENVAFIGARAPDRNGAGIRLERGLLTIRNCFFEDNENGILTNNDAGIELVIEGSEFVRNGGGDGQSHNLYVGSIARLAVIGSYFHAARVGHLLKSRAKESQILYNRLTDEPDGRASYELEFPAGGLAIVLGNLIQQGPRTENSVIVSMGAEGYRWERNELHFAHNTVVNDRPEGGVFILAKPGNAAVRVANNLFVGKGTFELNATHELLGNENAAWSEFALVPRLDLRLKARSRLVGRAGPAGAVGGFALQPDREYVYPTGVSRVPPGTPLSPGAFQSVSQ